MPTNFLGFFIANPTYSTEKLRILLRLYFGISEIDCYDYRGDRIRTCDLVLPKHMLKQVYNCDLLLITTFRERSID